jgi:hypothetical protein
MNREQWLNLLVDRFRDWFKDTGAVIPDKVRVSIGWPSRNALSLKKRAIGQCWHPDCSTDNSTEIFVSPFLGTAHQAASTLLHELTHAAVGNECGHKGAFIKVAKKLGFEKPWTQTPESEDLTVRINELLKDMPDFPHATLDAAAIEKLVKKQATRLLKVECTTCGYTVRVTKKWLLESGAPICPCNNQPMTAPDLDDLGEDESGEERKAA